MRRGGRGSIVQAPWRRRDDAIPSALHLDRGWGARNYVKGIVLAACSTAISIIIWSSRPKLPRESHLLGHKLPSRDWGIVFPLYRYYQQFPNGSHVGGHERWRGSRVGFHGRGIRSEKAKALFELHGGHRIEEDFYIKIKLGDCPKPFHFHIDTGSGPLSWVYCDDPGRYGSSVDTFGPNGPFVVEERSFVKCTGETASMCRALQAAGKEECDRTNDYDCLFTSEYFDGSTYWGRVVNGSITLPMLDKTEKSCTFEKVGDTETRPSITDGVIGLGNCKGTLVDQLSTSNAISQNVLGVCLAKEMISASPAAPVGFISLGMDFKEQFDHQSYSVSNWVKLLHQPGILCAYGAKLLYIFVNEKRISVKFADKTVGMTMHFDTGSDLTYLQKDVYDQVLKALDTYATNRDYVRKEDNEYIAESAQRVCWEPPSKKRKRGKSMPKASPYHDFGPLKLGFEGIASTMEAASLQYLVIQPVNYLIWDEDEIKLCVNILQDTSAEKVSNLGADIMREHLFVFDVENQRVRWTASSGCLSFVTDAVALLDFCQLGDPASLLGHVSVRADLVRRHNTAEVDNQEVHELIST